MEKTLYIKRMLDGTWTYVGRWLLNQNSNIQIVVCNLEYAYFYIFILVHASMSTPTVHHRYVVELAHRHESGIKC